MHHDRVSQPSIHRFFSGAVCLSGEVNSGRGGGVPESTLTDRLGCRGPAPTLYSGDSASAAVRVLVDPPPPRDRDGSVFDLHDRAPSLVIVTLTLDRLSDSLLVAATLEHRSILSVGYQARVKWGGGSRARTDDLRLARATLSQLSYAPICGTTLLQVAHGCRPPNPARLSQATLLRPEAYGT